MRSRACVTGSTSSALTGGQSRSRRSRSPTPRRANCPPACTCTGRSRPRCRGSPSTPARSISPRRTAGWSSGSARPRRPRAQAGGVGGRERLPVGYRYRRPQRALPGRARPRARRRSDPGHAQARPGYAARGLSRAAPALAGRPHGARVRIPTFAAAYPHAPNVFGMWDALDDGAGETAVSYLVAGWHGDTARQPRWEKQRENLAADTGWHGDGIAGATRSLCAGVIAGVDRNASVPQAAAKDVDLALGQTVTEAFAALLAARDGGADAASRARGEPAAGGLAAGADHAWRGGALRRAAAQRALRHRARRLGMGARAQHARDRRDAAPGGDRRPRRRRAPGRRASPGRPRYRPACAQRRPGSADALARSLAAARGQLYVAWTKFLEREYSTDALDVTVPLKFLHAAVADVESDADDLAQAQQALADSADDLRTRAGDAGYDLPVGPPRASGRRSIPSWSRSAQPRNAPTASGATAPRS